MNETINQEMPGGQETEKKNILKRIKELCKNPLVALSVGAVIFSAGVVEYQKSFLENYKEEEQVKRHQEHQEMPWPSIWPMEIKTVLDDKGNVWYYDIVLPPALKENGFDQVDIYGFPMMGANRRPDKSVIALGQNNNLRLNNSLNVFYKDYTMKVMDKEGNVAGKIAFFKDDKTSKTVNFPKNPNDYDSTSNTDLEYYNSLIDQTLKDYNNQITKAEPGTPFSPERAGSEN